MKAEDFSVRCYHESLSYPYSSVVTLTYEAEPASVVGAVRDVQLWLKRVRRKVGKLRYAAVVERGSLFGRLHAHALVFGHDFRESGYGGYVSHGREYYYSGVMDSCWPHGIAQVMPASPEAIFYAAGDAAKNFERESHLLWSKKPFLGFEFLERFGSDLVRNNFCTIDGAKHPVPDVYVRREEFAELFAPLKAARGFHAEGLGPEDIERAVRTGPAREVNLRATLQRRRGEF